MDLRPVVSEKDFALQPGAHVHLVGIGGFGLSAIARVLLGSGYEVSGSDQMESSITADLLNEGARIFQGHQAENAAGADVVLVSSAIPTTNPEILEARRMSIPVVKRAEFLEALLSEKFTIAVAGTHGKTTTTGIITQILVDAGMDPSFIVGGNLPETGVNGRAGSSQFFVIEADEYDRMFLGLRPQISVITNIDFDHPDMFSTRQLYRQAFQQFFERIKPGGNIVVWADDEETYELVQSSVRDDVFVVTYGLSSGDWRAPEVRPNRLGGSDFVVQQAGDDLGLARLRIPGTHNVLNALASIAVTSLIGLEFQAAVHSLGKFGGVSRRFELLGEVGSVAVVDDYAHHPAEIRATLAAARQRFPGRRIWAIWQPHTYTRIKYLLDEFEDCFTDADRLVVLEIFRSRETDNLGITGQEIAKAIKHPQVSYQASLGQASIFILERIIPGDVAITLTAGDGNIVGRQLLDGIARRLNNGSSEFSRQ